MVELLVVLAILFVLAGLVVGVAIRVARSTDEKLTSTRLAQIKQMLEGYANDNNGIYPVGDDYSSRVLYQVLSGDSSGQGDDPDGEVYWGELTDESNPNLVGEIAGGRVILDGFGESFRYRAAEDEDGNPVAGVRNADFDLWSVGRDGLPKGFTTSGLTKNNDTKDDIWK